MSDPVDDLRAAERRLQVAQLRGDVEALDRLLDDRLIFTLGVTGGTYTKADDLDLHRSGRQSLNRVDEEDLAVLVAGDTGVTWFLGVLSGSFEGEAFHSRMRYTRTWVMDRTHGWRVVAAHASEVPGPADLQATA
ncbi:nuclear transport factor 2 family protein [Micromonospora sp. SL4-19]|uniref:nuclear transport factor 2 family protein n=1 Tax=Micromonospora sp. SL4-19 TaxID=3399129 RepID=UPI003A4D2F4E